MTTKTEDGLIMTGVVCFLIITGIVIGVGVDRWTIWHKCRVAELESLIAVRDFNRAEFNALQREFGGKP